MSGKPSPDGVRDFLSLLAVMSEASTEITRLRNEIVLAQDYLMKANDAYSTAKETLFKLMRDMDVHASGNYGYEGRMSLFLVELFKQMSDTQSTGEK